MPEPVRPCVLVVEDEAIVRLNLVSELGASGCDVLDAADGPSAVALFQARPDIDAVVIDIGLPGGMTGYEVVRTIRADRPNCTVIIASGRDLVMPHDFDEYVMVEPKPYDVAKIALIVRMRHANDI